MTPEPVLWPTVDEQKAYWKTSRELEQAQIELATARHDNLTAHFERINAKLDLINAKLDAITLREKYLNAPDQ